MPHDVGGTWSFIWKETNWAASGVGLVGRWSFRASRADETARIMEEELALIAVCVHARIAYHASRVQHVKQPCIGRPSKGLNGGIWRKMPFRVCAGSVGYAIIRLSYFLTYNVSVEFQNFFTIIPCKGLVIISTSTLTSEGDVENERRRVLRGRAKVDSGHNKAQSGTV